MSARSEANGKRSEYDRGFRLGARSGQRKGYAEAVNDAARVAEKWADQYPPEVWPETGTSLDAKAAGHARRVAGFIAEDIRKMVVSALAGKETP